MIPLARIAILIPSLGRENDHEIVATARAIGAALRGAGHDFHDLARALDPRGAEAVGLQTAPSRNSSTWAPSHRAWQAGTDRDRARWLSLYGGAALTERERDFVDGLVRQLGRRGATASPRQSAWLNAIFARVSRGAAA